MFSKIRVFHPTVDDCLVVRLFRLLRLAKLGKLSETMEDMCSSRQKTAVFGFVLAKVFACIFTCAHFIACAWYQDKL